MKLVMLASRFTLIENKAVEMMEQKPNQPRKVNPATHATLLALVGGYVVYLAYQMLQSRTDVEGDISPTLAILIAVFFALAGIGVIVYAVRMWLKDRRDKAEEQAKDAPVLDAPEEDTEKLDAPEQTDETDLKS